MGKKAIATQSIDLGLDTSVQSESPVCHEKRKKQRRKVDEEKEETHIAVDNIVPLKPKLDEKKITELKVQIQKKLNAGVSLEAIENFCFSEEMYPYGVEGRAFEILTPPTTDQKEFLGINSRGMFYRFKNETITIFEGTKEQKNFVNEHEYFQWLCRASFEHPIVPGENDNWEGLPQETRTKLDADSLEFSEYLAKKMQVTKEAKNDWKTANTDAMTGLLNRSILKIGEQAYLERKTVTIASFDGDNFGALNKLKGLGYGDWMIKIMGNEFQKMIQVAEAEVKQDHFFENINPELHVGRMGGEEFVVMAVFDPNLASNELKKTAELEGESIATRLGKRMEAILGTHMIYMKDRIAERIQDTLSEEETTLLQDFLFETKGMSHTISSQQIGTSTSAISSVNFSEVDPDLNLSPEKATTRALANVDHYLERMKGGKDEDKGSGKNSVTIDERNAEANAGRLNRASKNLLSDEQNQNIQKPIQDILDKKEERKIAQLPETVAEFYHEIKEKLGKEAHDEIVAFVESPKGKPLVANWKAEILQKYGKKIKDLDEKLDIARRAFKKYAAQYEPTLGTMHRSAYEKTKEPNSIEIEIDQYQFKCLNETLGHVNADRILDLNVQTLFQVAAQFEIDFPRTTKNLY